MIRLDPVCFTFRGYNEDIDLNKPLPNENKPYNLVGSVTITDDEAYIHATLGEFNTEVLTALNVELYKYGIKTLWWKHKGQRHEMTMKGIL